MDIRKLQRAIIDGLEDVKAQNIVVYNTEHLSALFERVIIASGTSNRQTRSLASSVRERVKAAGAPPPRLEGEGNGEWIIVDCGAAVVHVMQPTIREYYHLEELWGDKPVKIKLGNETVRLVKAAEPDDDAHGEPVDDDAAKSPARRAALRGPQRGARSVDDGAAVATKAPAKRAATQSVGLKAAPTKTPRPKAGVPGTVVGKNAARKTATTQAPVRRSKTNSTTMTVDATPRREVAKSAARVAGSRAPMKSAVGASRSGVTRTVGVKSAAVGSAASTGAKRPPAKRASPTRKVTGKG